MSRVDKCALGLALCMARRLHQPWQDPRSHETESTEGMAVQSDPVPSVAQPPHEYKSSWAAMLLSVEREV